MRKALLFIAIAMALGIAGEAFAGSDEARGNAPRTTWLDEGAIKSKLSDLGYSVRKIETEDGATDKNGAKVELYADPATGEIERPGEMR